MANPKLQTANYAMVTVPEGLHFYNASSSFTLTEFPAYLPALLHACKKPLTRQQLFTALKTAGNAITKQQLNNTIAELLEAGLLQITAEIPAGKTPKPQKIGVIDLNGIGTLLRDALLFSVPEASCVVLKPQGYEAIDDEEQLKKLFDKNFRECTLLVLDNNFSKPLVQLAEAYCIKHSMRLMLINTADNFSIISLHGFAHGPLCFDCFLESIVYRRQFTQNANLAFRSAENKPLMQLVTAIAASLISTGFTDENYFFNACLVYGNTRTERLLLQNRPGCATCRQSVTNNLATLPAVYSKQRAGKSLNSAVLDDFIINLAGSGKTILDVGCGIGSLSIPLAERYNKVVANDISAGMLEQFRQLVPPSLVPRIKILHGDLLDLDLRQLFDVVLCNLVLDHIEAPQHLLAKCNRLLKKNGRLIAVLPHPFKDSGYWEKTSPLQEAETFTVTDYFREGRIIKSRFNEQGEQVIKEISSYKRNIGTYASLLHDAGFCISRIFEPAPADKTIQTVQVRRAAQVPYFLVLVCTKA